MPAYNNSKGQNVLHFGQGDIVIGYGRSIKGESGGPINSLTFGLVEPGSVGRVAIDEPCTPIPLFIHFESTESLDVFAESLARLRGLMTGDPIQPL